jgi:HNH endonuclease
MNLVAKSLSNLKSRNYVTKAKRSRNYSFNFYANRMQKTREKFGNEFFLIIYDPLEDDDFYMIPYGLVASAFTKENLVQHGKGGLSRSRWVERIAKDILRVSHGDDLHFDLNSYYGNQLLLEQALGHDDVNRLKLASDDALEESVRNDPTLAETEKQAIIRARRGQGLFRSNVASIERACRLTHVTHPDLLEASHIKAWGKCSSHKERLDGHNGLLLTPTAHLLFDRGLISFQYDGRVLVSTAMDAAQLGKLGITGLPGVRGTPTLNVGTFTERQATYLAYHRENTFRP